MLVNIEVNRMKEIDNVKYYNIVEICEMFDNKFNQDTIEEYFKKDRIKGRQIDNEWYADKKSIEAFMETLAKDKVFFINPQKIDLSNIELRGRILDIGGGGEGVIGQLKREQVVAIDLHDYELEGAPPGEYLKIVMDAKDMKFIGESFDTVTSFFTLMYMPSFDRKKVFEEVHRVLKKAGEFHIWDIIIPDRGNNEKEMVGIMIEIKIKEKNISTGYGTFWDKTQTLDDYLRLGKEAGFKRLESEIIDNTFYIKFQKT